MNSNLHQVNTMDELDKAWTEALIRIAEFRLERALKQDERNALSKTRSLMAYEMIEDTLRDETLSREQINQYVQAVTKEEKK